MAYEYLMTPRFFADLMTTHTLGEFLDLLAASVKFSQLRMVNIEAEDLVHGLTNYVSIWINKGLLVLISRPPSRRSMSKN